MACDTFIKIAQKCRRHFVQIQSAEVMPFIEEILQNISSIICDLQPQQVQTFYEAVGYMISAQTDSAVQKHLIDKYMSLPNQVRTILLLLCKTSFKENVVFLVRLRLPWFSCYPYKSKVIFTINTLDLGHVII